MTEKIKESMFQELLNSVYEGILITSEKGEIAIANEHAAELFLLSVEGLCICTMDDLVSGFGRDILQNIKDSLESEQHILLEASCVKHDGSVFPAEIALHKINLNSEPQLCFSIRDVSARAAAQNKLEEARDELIRAETNKTRMDTITTLAHEINNPLQMLLGMVEADNNIRYAAPLNRITTVIQQLRLQEELKSVKYAGGSHRFEIPSSDIVPSAPKRLLVVDDEVTLQRFFESILTAKIPGLVVDCAANGREAIAEFRAKHQSIIILDISMPVMDGEEAYHEIRKICKGGKWEMPAVIFCTGYTPPESIRRVLETEQAHCYLPKPVTGDVLVDAVKNRMEFYELCHTGQVEE